MSEPQVLRVPFSLCGSVDPCAPCDLCRGLLCTAAPASAASRGTLTSAEYQQLHTAEKRIKSLSARDTRGLRQAQSVCSRLRPVSPLITAVRSGCLDLITLGGDDAKLNAAAIKCGIDPGTEAAIFTCLIPRSAGTTRMPRRSISRRPASTGSPGRAASAGPVWR